MLVGEDDPPPAAHRDRSPKAPRRGPRRRAFASSRRGRARRSRRPGSGVLSRASAALNAASTAARFALISMSTKSMTMIPPMSRSRSWRAISSAASRLFSKTVSSRLEEPTFLPVLTSMTVSASVRSMMSEPPEGSQTLRSSALWSCSCTWWRSKSGQRLGRQVVELDTLGELRVELRRRSRARSRTARDRR